MLDLLRQRRTSPIGDDRGVSKSLDIKPFRARPGRRIDLRDWSTRVESFYKSKADYEERLAAHVRRLNQRQTLLYAHDRYALLLIFQAMDAAGKDGVIKHVMSGVNPQGCQVFSFKHPSAEDLDHDFLWRTSRSLPERGRIGIFNRSYYEEVLIVRVHDEILRGQRLPDEAFDDGGIWKGRYRSIVDLEDHLYRNGTRVVKFFLHVSKDEQRARFLARLDDPDKTWKFSASDLKERGRWDEYMKSYAECIEATTTKRSPWYIVPADDKPNARLIVSEAIVATLDAMDMRFPEPTAAELKELADLRAALAREAGTKRHQTKRRV
jgi:PPK2 family polyphosphate:nucleotide phosphotransferase